ncbi:enoyl-CoA hydratase/isomerase family protein [Chloroflexota bacterium]
MKFIKYAKEKEIAIVTMDRPKLNAMNLEMMAELEDTWKTIENDSAVRVTILTGKGRGYNVGFDIKEMAEGKFNTSLLQTMMPLYFSPRSQSKPVIAAVNGLAVGAGFDFMAMDADLLIAAESATFSMPEVSFGMASLGSPFSSANIPRVFAMEIVLTGEAMSSSRAYEVGLVNRVVPDDQLLEQSIKMAEKIARNSVVAVKQSRKNLLLANSASEASRIQETFAAASPEMRDATDKGINGFSRKETLIW